MGLLSQVAGAARALRRRLPHSTKRALEIRTFAGAMRQLIPDTTAMQRLIGINGPRELSEMFDLDVNEDNETYFLMHWERYLTTIEMLPEGKALRILDVGSAPPYVFFALLKLLRPDAEFTTIIEAQHAFVGTHRVVSKSGDRDFEVKVVSLNAEQDRYPFDSSSFDVVLAMEILEHFVLNPLHMLVEAHRLLAPHGSLLVTTPNIVSARSLFLAHAGTSPYCFGLYLPEHGVYGRHNREYTPREVELLGYAAGFETQTLKTLDVYGDESKFFAPGLLASSAYPLAMRGRNVFYSGRRVNFTWPDAWRSFYYGRPPA
jgi:SAM-dependent methyltransferase